MSISQIPGAYTVFDIQVEGAHDFFAGEGRILVHNCDGDGEAAAPVGYNRPVRERSTVEVDGRRVHQDDDLFTLGRPTRVDPSVDESIRRRVARGETNLDLMRRGRAPIGHDGRQVNLHHVIGQEPGPMVELGGLTHERFGGPLHSIIIDGTSFRRTRALKRSYDRFRARYWRWRARQVDSIRWEGRIR